MCPLIDSSIAVESEDLCTEIAWILPTLSTLPAAEFKDECEDSSVVTQVQQSTKMVAQCFCF